MRKHKINNKKGISLVVAMALSIFLFMITGTFLSVALLQQNDTGAELNTRQAYISAKSALDLAKNMIEQNRITVSSADGTHYYVLYKSGSNIKVNEYTTINESTDFINNNKSSVIGNSYVKITKSGNKCTATAFSTEGKYNNDKENYGDLSFSFNVKTVTTPAVYQNIVFNDTLKPYGSLSNSNRFLMVGMQTNFSLLKSVTGKDFKTVKQEEKSSDTPYTVIDEPYLNTNECPVNSHFPIVYNNTVKINSDSYRCVYQAYDDGIYFMGNYSGNSLSDYSNPKPKDVCYFTNNNSYGSELHCNYVVFAHNVVSRTQSGMPSLLVKAYGSNCYKYDNQYGVVINLPNGSTFASYDGNGNCTFSRTYAKGYYWVKTGSSNNGTDLISAGTNLIPIKTDNEIYQNAASSIDIYNSLVDNNGDLLNLRSACETESTGTKIQILNTNGTFNSNSEYNYSPTSTYKFTSAFENASIYCGPSQAPSKAGYYNLYCGNEFNFLWYNTNKMTINAGVKIHINSSNNVVTIGPDMNEAVYKFTQAWGYEYRSANKGESDYPTSDYMTSNNNLTAADSSSEFWLSPYTDGASYTITVMSDFNVNYSGNSYTIKKGVYYSELPQNGFNLFSSDAKTFFENHIPAIGSDSNDVGWVKDGEIVSTKSPQSQSGKSINFSAIKGTLYHGEYKAKIINCDFSGFTSPLNTNDAVFSCDKLIIDAPKGLEGNTLNVKPTGGSNVTVDIDGTKFNGIYIKINNNIDIKNSTETFSLAAGTYFFKSSDFSGEINIMSRDTWKKACVAGIKEITPSSTSTTIDSEGGYY